MSKNELLIQTLEERRDNVKMWNIYSDGFKDGLEFAIELIRLTEEFQPSKEMEVAHV